MKKIILIAVFSFLYINSGCIHLFESSKEAGFTPPVLKNKPRLYYPKDAQEKSFTGTTEVIISVSNKGNVEDVQLSKSSGYRILDSAAVMFCREFIFTPAIRDNEEVYSKIIWIVEFRLSDQDAFRNSYVNDVSRLYQKISGANSDKRKEFQQEIFEKHKEFANTIWDRTHFNATMAKVIMPETVADWKEAWDEWPLSFLLYHDFIQRYPDYDSIAIVREELQRSLVYDSKYIRQTKVDNVEQQKEKDNLLLKIDSFISKNYPDINLDTQKMGENRNS